MKIFKGFKKVHIIIAAVAVLLVYSFVLVNIAQAVTNAEPGSDGDPIVAQSYVDAKINEANQKINEVNLKISDFTAKIADLTAKNTALTDNNKQLTDSLSQANKQINDLTAVVDSLKSEIDKLKASGGGKGSVFEVLELKKGKILTLGASAEIILRGGKATAIASANGGLSDLTAGTGVDIKTGQAIPLNHLILISRDDGRGLKVTSDQAWVMVRGTYTIK